MNFDGLAILNPHYKNSSITNPIAKATINATALAIMNVRYFETEAKAGNESTYWFGGGIDLTPHYVTADSGKFIHTKLKEVCDQTDPKYYPKFKKWADDYFFIKHRDETRGVGISASFVTRGQERPGKQGVRPKFD